MIQKLIQKYVFYWLIYVQCHNNLVILCSLYLILIIVPSPTAPRVNLRCLIVVFFFIPFWSFQKGQGKSKSKACKKSEFFVQIEFDMV